MTTTTNTAVTATNTASNRRRGRPARQTVGRAGSSLRLTRRSRRRAGGRRPRGSTLPLMPAVVMARIDLRSAWRPAPGAGGATPLALRRRPGAASAVTTSVRRGVCDVPLGLVTLATSSCTSCLAALSWPRSRRPWVRPRGGVCPGAGRCWNSTPHVMTAARRLPGRRAGRGGGTLIVPLLSAARALCSLRTIASRWKPAPRAIRTLRSHGVALRRWRPRPARDRRTGSRRCQTAPGRWSCPAQSAPRRPLPGSTIRNAACRAREIIPAFVASATRRSGERSWAFCLRS